jgi:hypothetical protein
MHEIRQDRAPPVARIVAAPVEPGPMALPSLEQAAGSAKELREHLKGVRAAFIALPFYTPRG